MSIATSQQLQNYYDHYRDTEVTYSKEILKTLSLDPRQIYLKCNGSQWPCIINSTSFQYARIIIGNKGGAYAQISKESVPPISLRFCFIGNDNQPIFFFISGRVTDVTKYMNSTELVVVTIAFTQRPPDDFIEKIGTLLEANANAIRRKEERIVIDEDSKRKLFLEKDETIVFIQNVPRRCVLRDISFSGAKVVMMGISKFVQEKETILRIHFEEPDEIFNIIGTVVSTNTIEGRRDIIFVSIKFNEPTVPLSYKIRINNYLNAIRRHILLAQNETKAQVAQAQTLAKEANAKKENDVNDAKDNETQVENKDTEANEKGATPISTKDAPSSSTQGATPISIQGAPVGTQGATPESQ